MSDNVIVGAFVVAVLSFACLLVMAFDLYHPWSRWRRQQNKQIAREIENVLAVKAKAARLYAVPKKVS